MEVKKKKQHKNNKLEKYVTETLMIVLLVV